MLVFFSADVRNEGKAKGSIILMNRLMPCFKVCNRLYQSCARLKGISIDVFKERT